MARLRWLKRYQGQAWAVADGGVFAPSSGDTSIAVTPACSHGSCSMGGKASVPVSPTCMCRCPMWRSRPPKPPGSDVS